MYNVHYACLQNTLLIQFAEAFSDGAMVRLAQHHITAYLCG